VDAPVRVWSAHDVRLDAWRGAAHWVGAGPAWRAASVTRADYDEHGADWLREHRFSNWYTPTPAAPDAAAP
jgi:actin-related protein 5